MKGVHLVKEAEANVTGKAGEVRLWETLKDSQGSQKIKSRESL